MRPNELKRVKEEITPERAAEMLATNYINNRRIRKSVVSRFKADIVDGRWNEDISLVDQPIAFSNTGFLINGQHRLRAILESGMTVYAWCVYGVPEELYNYFDGGVTRSVPDIINVPNATGAATIGKVMYAIKYGQAPLTAALNGVMRSGHPSISVTRQQTIAIINEDDELINRYINLGQRSRTYMGHNPNNLAIPYYIIDFVGRGDQLERFVDECSSMIPTASAVIACRSYMNNCMSSRNFKKDRKWFASCVFTAYEAFRSNKQISQFNKINVTFSKYDKYINEAREAKEVK